MVRPSLGTNVIESPAGWLSAADRDLSFTAVLTHGAAASSIIPSWRLFELASRRAGVLSGLRHVSAERIIVSVVVIGLNHRTVPLDLLERVTIDDLGLTKVLHDLVSRDNLAEVVVLSTCNRTEIYAVAERFHGAYGDVRDFLSELGHLAPEEFSHQLYSH